MRRGRKHSVRLGIGVLVSLVVLGACGSDDNKSTEGGSTDGKKTIAIGMVGPLTGDNANLGVNIRDGVKVAIDEWNKKSTKYTYQLKEFDTQGDPAQAPTQMDRYIPDSSIVGIVGPAFSGETKAVIPNLQQAGLVM